MKTTRLGREICAYAIRLGLGTIYLGGLQGQGRAEPDKPKSSELLIRAQTDTAFRKALKEDWRAVFKTQGVPAPKGDLIFVERPKNGAVLILEPLPSEAANAGIKSSTLATRPEKSGRSRPTTERKCTDCPGGDPDDPRPKPAPAPNEVIVSTVQTLKFKRWNQNPFGPGCKNDAIFSFVVPEKSSLHSVTIGENGCGANGEDVPVNKYIDTHVALGIRAGAVVLSRRPQSGANAGQKSLEYHWWFNQWGHVQFSLCINVSHKRKDVMPSQESYDHLNMDDGLKAYPINSPICLDRVGAKFECPDLQACRVSPDASVKGCEHASLWWFGCKNDKGQVVVF